MKIPSNGIMGSSGEGEKKEINSELWHACAGPLVSLPVAGSLVVYFPQGHSEQVAATMQKEMDGTPSYPNLPSKLICMLRSVTLLADSETDEVYAQMTLQPVNKYDHDALLVSDFGLKSSRQPGEFFCKTLTASDTSTHGGFSVPRRAAEKIFPPLDFSMQPPAQELTARDLHNHTWTFRHIYRGQPKRHLLTSGWSVFVNSKRLVAGDAVLFIRDEKSQLLLGTRRANRQQPALSSSVMSSDSMHIGILAAAAHAAANSSPFTIFYNPRATSSEFVVPLAKYNKAMYTQVTPGMRFRMMFETEESGVRRYMGTVTSVSDLDPVRWKNSQWRNIQVGWDESAAGERPSRVSIWDIEPVVTPFYICPPPFFRPKLPGHHPGFTDDNSDVDNIFNRSVPWASEEFGLKDASSSSVYPGLSLVQWMSLQQNHQPLPSMVSSNVLPGNGTGDDHSKLFHFQQPLNFQMRNGSLPKQSGQVPQSTVSWPQQQQLQQTLPSPGMVQQPQHQQHQQPQLQHQLPLQQTQQNAQQQQQSMIMHPVTSSMTSEKAGMNPHQPTVYSQVQQQESLTGTTQLQQNGPFTTGGATVSAASLTQSLLFQQNTAQQRNLVQSHPQPQQNLPNQQQQRQKQISASMNSFLEHQSNPEHEMQLPSLPPPQSSGSSFSASMLMQSQQFPANQAPGQQKAPLVNGGYSNWTDSNGPSCSTSLYKSNLQVPHGNGLRNHTGSAALQENSIAHLSSSTVHESNSKIDVQVNHNLPISKASEHPKCKGSAVDHLDAASSATSYCFDTGGLQQNFPLAGLDDVQSHIQSSVPFATAVDGLTPDALLLRSSESGKDVHNLFSGYDGAPRDIETDFSSGINSQSFGLPNMFKPGYSNNADINETGVLNGGPWPNQSQRMRTYTKVQKRGSVGRTIDVTRYMGYDELRNDLARMFGIEGLLEDPQQTEWKLVYVDQEHDILLVGDDPWEEFVGCVQSIKILSSGEVQQMSLDGDLGGQLGAAPNQACSSTDNGNAWR